MAKRDRTEREVRRHLASRGIGDDTAEAAIAELGRQGYVDDARFAARFAEDRRALDGWGSERIERRLRELGVPDEHVAAAVGARTHDDERAAALDLLVRRFPALGEDPRDRERAFGVLVRKGFEPELAGDAVREHARSGSAA